MIKLTKENYWQEIEDSKLSQAAKGYLKEMVGACLKQLIPPMVNNEAEFNELAAEIGQVLIDQETFQLVKLPMNDEVSFRIKLIKAD